MGFILLNMLTMTLEHYDQHDTFEKTLSYLNGLFIVIFTLECMLKMIGLRQYYFKEPWNIFDFVVVIGSILSTMLCACSCYSC